MISGLKIQIILVLFSFKRIIQIIFQYDYFEETNLGETVFGILNCCLFDNYFDLTKPLRDVFMSLFFVQVHFEQVYTYGLTV